MPATDGSASTTPIKMSQLAEASGLTVSTIKFYISRGLLPRPVKSKPNVAFYDQRFLRCLLMIKKMRSEGLSISSIKSILDKYPFDRVSEWEDFKKKARKKESFELEAEERLATLSDEERRTESILDAALEVFQTKGYHNSTVDDIAQQAGVSKGTCYQYFSGKEEVFLSTIDRTLDRLIVEADAAAGGAKDALQRLGLKGLTFISKYRDLQFMFIGMFTEVMGGNERIRKKAADVYEKVAEFLVRDLDAGVREKAFRKVNTTAVAYALIGIAEVVGNRDMIDEDFDVLSFFVDLMDFMQHGLSADDA
jgi:AcrR family transcriptional regulator/predicted DNA-binding transcriptional regulator AlpA